MVCLVIALTVWIWVPLAMFLCYLFNILVFQFEIGYYNRECIIRSLPLISLMLKLLFHIGRILSLFLFLIIISPLIVFLYFILLMIQRFLRSISDGIMLCFIKCLARTPSTNSSMATKISGPGMSRNFYYSINEEDVYILVQS